MILGGRFVSMFVFKIPPAEKSLLKSPCRAVRVIFSLSSQIWAANCGEASVSLHPRKELKLPHEQLFLPMKRQPAFTLRGERDCGHSTFSRLEIYLPRQSLPILIFRLPTQHYLMCGGTRGMTPKPVWKLDER